MKPKLLQLTILATLISFSISGWLIADENVQIIKITAKKFEYSPSEIIVKKGIPVELELTSLDRLHGFNCPGLKIRTDITPGKVNTLRFVPGKAGKYPFHCDIFCGLGHGEMRGTIIVTE